MDKKDFLSTMKSMVAVTSVGPSALRGQGKGVLGATQKYLERIDLSKVQKLDESSFKKWLDHHTKNLLRQLPISGRPWGAARKALNLFLRDALYNQYLSKSFKMTTVEQWLEIPLDSAVASGLKKHAGRGNLPQWLGLKKLQPKDSDRFQEYALVLARRRGLYRVHLDIYLWPEYR